YFLVFLQILLGVYLIWHAWQWLGYVRRRLHSDPGFYTPRVAVLCPCKGMEPGLERNLLSLTEFERQNYEIFFILASASDPARSIVERVAKNSRVKANVIIAGNPSNSGEKVNNLRVAVEQLPPEFEVLVFTDSDGCPARRWLHHLVSPLGDVRICSQRLAGQPSESVKTRTSNSGGSCSTATRRLFTFSPELAGFPAMITLAFTLEFLATRSTMLRAGSEAEARMKKIS